MAFGPTNVQLDETASNEVLQTEWEEIYGPLYEEMPPKIPMPLGKPVDITCLVDADHAGNVMTRGLSSLFRMPRLYGILRNRLRWNPRHSVVNLLPYVQLVTC